MAASGGSGRSSRGESDESFDFTCSSCVMKNRNREATKFCLECQDYYCDTCLEFHKDIRAMKDHTLLGKSEFPTTVAQNLMSLPMERCSDHPAKVLDMYCKSHDQIGCHVCMAVKHRSCVDPAYIPEEIDIIMKAEDVQKIKEDMVNARIRMEELIQARHNNLAEVEQDKGIALIKIKEVREKINVALDELEKTTIADFEAKSKDIANQIYVELEAMDAIVKDMETCQQQLDSADGSRSQQFVCTKKGQQKISEADKLITDVAQSSGNTRVEFEQDPKIEQFLKGLSSLGKAVKQHDCLYQVTSKQTIDVSASGDRETCHILGSCILKSGNILLADLNNQKLKQLDGFTYKVIDQCDMPGGYPCAVCELSPQEAAVTIPDRTIRIVSLGARMVITRSIKTNHKCWGLAFSHGEMFVSDCGKQVYVYDTSGTRLRTICKDQSGEDIFSISRHVAVSDDGNKVYVADEGKGVVTLDRQGRVLSRFSDQELKGACGVCGDGCGNIFVCGRDSHNVIQIGPSGNKIGVLAKQSDVIAEPASVCYDRSTSRLVVTNNVSNNLRVFGLM